LDFSSVIFWSVLAMVLLFEFPALVAYKICQRGRVPVFSILSYTLRYKHSMPG